MGIDLPIQQKTSDSELATTILLPSALYRHDPLLMLFKDKLRLGYFWIFAGSVLLAVIGFFALYALPGVSYGSLVSNPLFILLEISTAIVFYVVYLFLPHAIVYLFNRLNANGVIGEPRQAGSTSYEVFLKKLVIWESSVWWVVGILAFIVLYLINRYLAGGPPFLRNLPLWLQISTAVLDAYIAYATLISGIRLLIALVFVNWLFRSFTIRVNPLHPDGAGGLGVMRHILWISAGIIFGTTLTFYQTIQIENANGIFTSALDLVVLIAAYIVLTTSLLLGWLFLPHQVMVKARNAALQPLADEFQRVMAQNEQFAGEDFHTFKANNELLHEIRKRYQLFRDTFPTWPLELQEVRGLIAALSLPALISLVVPYIPILFNLVISLLPK